MSNDVRTQSESLRDVLKPFIEPIDENTTIIAPSPEFVVLQGQKLYFKLPLMYMEIEKIPDFSFCGNKCKNGTGFVVALRDDKFAYECDICNHFTVFTRKLKHFRNLGKNR